MTWFILTFSCLGAYVDSADYQGSTPLHIAAQYGQELLLSVLLASGADPSKWVHQGMIHDKLSGLCNQAVWENILTKKEIHMSTTFIITVLLYNTLLLFQKHSPFEALPGTIWIAKTVHSFM